MTIEADDFVLFIDGISSTGSTYNIQRVRSFYSIDRYFYDHRLSGLFESSCYKSIGEVLTI